MYKYFAVISAMRTQATSRCQSLAKYFGSIVDFSTWCLVHWNADPLIKITINFIPSAKISTSSSHFHYRLANSQTPTNQPIILGIIFDWPPSLATPTSSISVIRCLLSLLNNFSGTTSCYVECNVGCA